MPGTTRDHTAKMPGIEMLQIPDGTPPEKAHRETQQVLFSSTALHTNSGNIPIVFRQHGVPAVAAFEAGRPSTREFHAHFC